MEEEFEQIMGILREANLTNDRYTQLEAKVQPPRKEFDLELGCTQTVCSDGSGKIRQDTFSASDVKSQNPLSDMLFGNSTCQDAQSDRILENFELSDSPAESLDLGPRSYPELNFKCNTVSGANSPNQRLDLSFFSHIEADGPSPLKET